MLISNRAVLTSVLFGVALIAQASAASSCTKIVSLPQRSAGATLRFEGKNVEVDVDVSDDGVTVRSGLDLATSCKTSLSAISSIYDAGSNVIIFQSLEISAEDWFFIDKNNCRELRPPLHLGTMSQQAKKSKLRKAGYCVAD